MNKTNTQALRLVPKSVVVLLVTHKAKTTKQHINLVPLENLKPLTAALITSVSSNFLGTESICFLKCCNLSILRDDPETIKLSSLRTDMLLENITISQQQKWDSGRTSQSLI
jgi:hypothetical protein